MHEMTKQNLQSAFAGESQAHMKYMIFSEIAEKEGKKNIARLFKAIAYAELVHAKNHLKTLGGIGSLKEILETAKKGEVFEVEEMYPVYNNDAKFQGEKDAEKSTYYALEAEKLHIELYQHALEQEEKGNDLDDEKIYVCPICGYTAKGNAPDTCPICKAKKEIFKQF